MVALGSTAEIDGATVSFEVIGDGKPWAITPGGRFSKDYAGVRELAEALAEHGNQVLIWDRPNTGASEVRFDGDSESEMQADALAGLLKHLDMTPAVIAGGSGGSRVSLLTAARHPDVAAGLAIWWISGGVYGLMSLGVHYCGPTIDAAWRGGMAAVVELPEWHEVIERHPLNRKKILDQDPAQFIAKMEGWMAVYCPNDDEVVPGLTVAGANALDVPALVFRSGASDLHHTRATSENVARQLANAELVEPPWGDSEWNERMQDPSGLFVRWKLLVPTLVDWATRTISPTHPPE
jgi:pimeloyl-ACP methyl ester carboxylesterase